MPDREVLSTKTAQLLRALSSPQVRTTGRDESDRVFGVSRRSPAGVGAVVASASTAL